MGTATPFTSYPTHPTDSTMFICHGLIAMHRVWLAGLFKMGVRVNSLGKTFVTGQWAKFYMQWLFCMSGFTHVFPDVCV